MIHLIEHWSSEKTYCDIDAKETDLTLDDFYGKPWERASINDVECQACKDKHHEIGEKIKETLDDITEAGNMSGFDSYWDE